VASSAGPAVAEQNPAAAAGVTSCVEVDAVDHYMPGPAVGQLVDAEPVTPDV
jgi:hypothetical protein